VLIAALCGANAYATSDFVDTAQVVSSTPIIERVSEPRQECEQAPPQRSGIGSIAGPILGGIVGGLLGHQVGQGRGNTAATIVGATGGAAAGSVIANRANQPGQVCRTVESSREVVKGYNVVYNYNGRDVAVILPYNPGNTVKVGVGIVDDNAPTAERGDERREERREERGDNRRNRNSSYSRDDGPAAAGSNYSYRY
jgi:uncharacterized protein YcfJ